MTRSKCAMGILFLMLGATCSQPDGHAGDPLSPLEPLSFSAIEVQFNDVGMDSLVEEDPNAFFSAKGGILIGEDRTSSCYLEVYFGEDSIGQSQFLYQDSSGTHTVWNSPGNSQHCGFESDLHSRSTINLLLPLIRKDVASLNWLEVPEEVPSSESSIRRYRIDEPGSILTDYNRRGIGYFGDPAGELDGMGLPGFVWVKLRPDRDPVRRSGSRSHCGSARDCGSHRPAA